MEDGSKKVSKTGIQGSIGFKRADGSPLPISLEKLNINFESGKIISGSVEVNEAIKFTLPLAGEVTVNKKPGQKEPVILIDKSGLTVEGVGTTESGLFQCEFNSLLFDINLLRETPPAILSGNVKIKPEETSAVLLSAGSDGSINWKLVSALSAADAANLLEIRFALKEAITIDSQGAHLPKDPAIKAFMESSMLDNVSLEQDGAFLLSPSFNDGKVKLTAGSARFVYGGTAFAVYDKDGLRLTKDAALAALPDELYLPKKETAYLKLKDKNKLLVRVEKKDEGFYIWTEGENTIELYVPALGLKEPIKISIHKDKKLLVKTASDNRLELLEGTIEADAGKLPPFTRSSSDNKTSLEIKQGHLKLVKVKEKPLTLELLDAAATVSSPLFKDDSDNTVKLSSAAALTMDTTGAFTGVLKEIDLTKTKPVEALLDSGFKLSFTKADIKFRLSSSVKKEEESSAPWLTATLSGSAFEKPFSGLEVDLTSGKITAGNIILEQAVLNLPLFHSVKVEKAELNNKGLELSGKSFVSVSFEQEEYKYAMNFRDNFLLQVNLLDTEQTQIVSGSVDLSGDVLVLQISQEYEGGPTSYDIPSRLKVQKDDGSFNFMKLWLLPPSYLTLTLDKDGLHTPGDMEMSAFIYYRFGEFKLEEQLTAKFSQDFAIDIFSVEKSASASSSDGKQTVASTSQFVPKLKSGSADISLFSLNVGKIDKTSVAVLDKEGLKVDTAGMLFAKLPAELPLPTKEVMFMSIKDKEGKPLVKYKAEGENTIKIWTSSPATLTITALLSKGKPVTVPLSIPEGDAISVNVKDLKVSGGVISAAPASPVSFDYESLSFKLSGVQYDMESQQTKIDGSFELVLGEGASAQKASFHFKEFVVSQYGLSGQVDISDELSLPAFELSQVKLMLAGGKIVFQAGESDAKTTEQEMENQLNTQKKTIQTELEELEKEEKEFKDKLAKVTDITTIKQKLQEVENSMKELDKNKSDYTSELKKVTSALDEKRASLDKATKTLDSLPGEIKNYEASITSLEASKTQVEAQWKSQNDYLQELIKANRKSAQTKKKVDDLAVSIAAYKKSIEDTKKRIDSDTKGLSDFKEKIKTLNEEIPVLEKSEKEWNGKLSEVSIKIDAAAVEKLALEGELNKPVAGSPEINQTMLDSISAGVVSLKEEIKAVESKIQEVQKLSESGGKSVIKQISFLDLTGKVFSLPMGGELSTPVAFQGLSAAIEKGKVKFSGAFSAGATPEAQTWYYRRKEKLFARSDVVLGVFADGGSEPPVATLSLWNGKLAVPVYYVSMLFRDNKLRLASFDAGVKYGLSGDILETTMHLDLTGKDILYGKAVLADKAELLEWNNLKLDFDKGTIEVAASLSDPAKTQALFYDVQGRVNKLGGMAVDADRVSFAFSITENGVSGIVKTSLSSDNTAKPLFSGKGIEDKLSFSLNAVQFEFKDDKETSSTTLGGLVWKIDNKEYALQIDALTFKEGKLTGVIKGLDVLPAISFRTGTEFQLKEGKVNLNTDGELELAELKGEFTKIATVSFTTPLPSFSNCSWDEKGFSCKMKYTSKDAIFNRTYQLTLGLTAKLSMNELELEIKDGKFLPSTYKGKVTISREEWKYDSTLFRDSGYYGWKVTDSSTQDFSLELSSDGSKDKVEGKTTLSLPSSVSQQSSAGVTYKITNAELSVKLSVTEGWYHPTYGYYYPPGLGGSVEFGKAEGSLTSLQPIATFSPAIAFTDITDFALTGDGLTGLKEFSTPYETQVQLQDYDQKRNGTPAKLFINKLEMYGRRYRVVGEMTLKREDLPPLVKDAVSATCSSAKASVDFTGDTETTLITPGNKEFMFVFCKGEAIETGIRVATEDGFRAPNQPTLFVRFPSIDKAFLEIRGEQVTKGSKVVGKTVSFSGDKVKAILHLPFLGSAYFYKEDQIQDSLKANGFTYPTLIMELGSLKVKCGSWDDKTKLGTDCSVESLTEASGSFSSNDTKYYKKSDFTLNISKITLAYNGPSSVTECALQNSPYLKIEGSIYVPVLSRSTNFTGLYVDKDGVCGSASVKDIPQGSVKGNTIDVKSAKIIFKKDSARMEEMSGNITLNLDGKAVSVPFPKWVVSFPGAKEKKNYVASNNDYYFGTLAETNVKLTLSGDTDLIKSVNANKIKVDLQPGDAPSVSFVGTGEAKAVSGVKVGDMGDASLEGIIYFGLSAKGQWETNIKLTKYPTLKNLEIEIGKVAKIKAESGVMEVDDKKKSYMRLQKAKMTILSNSTKTMTSESYDVGDRIKVYGDHVEVDNSIGALSTSNNKILFIGSTSVDKFDFGKDAIKGDYFTLTGNFKAQFVGIVELSGGIDKLGTYKLFGDGTEEIGGFFLSGVGPMFKISGSFSWADIDNKEEVKVLLIDPKVCPSTTLKSSTLQDKDDKTDITAEVDVNIMKIVGLSGKFVYLSSGGLGVYIKTRFADIPIVVTPTLPPVPVIVLKGLGGGFMASGDSLSLALGATLGVTALKGFAFPVHIIFTYKNKTYMGALCGGFVFKIDELDLVNPVCSGGLALDFIGDPEEGFGFKGTVRAGCKFPPSTGSLIDADATLELCLAGDKYCTKKLSDYGNMKECLTGGAPDQNRIWALENELQGNLKKQGKYTDADLEKGKTLKALTDKKNEIEALKTKLETEDIRYYVSLDAKATLLKDMSFLNQKVEIKGIVDTYGFHLYGAHALKLDVDLKAVKAYADLGVTCLLCKMGGDGFWGELRGSGKGEVAVFGAGVSLNLKGKLRLETSPKFRFSGQIAGGACLGAGCGSDVCDSCIDTCCPNNPCQMESSACGQKDSCLDASFWKARGVGSGCANFTLP